MSGFKQVMLPALIDNNGAVIGFKELDGDETMIPRFSADYTALLKPDGSALAGQGAGYVLPVATSTVLGGVKAGTGVSIAGDGTLTAAGGGGGSGAADIAFSTTVSLNNTGGNYMPDNQPVTGPLTFTPGSSPVRGAFTFVFLKANGTNVPDVSAFTEHGSSMGYLNTANILNIANFFTMSGVNWVSWSQAAVPVAITTPTTVTLSGSNSGVVNTPTTFTVGTDGTRSGSVIVTPTPVANVTYSPTSVTLPPGTGTMTYTGTSTTTGAKSVAVTNNGGLANQGPINWTVAAAATAPGAPTIGTATVTGPTSASVAGTAPASDGGAAIDLYRATSTPGGITATSATLPVPVPGLTTGQAYTFTLAAHNSVNWSVESAASNSVTPVAAVAFPRLIENAQTGGTAHYTETGAPGPYGYMSTGIYPSTQQLEYVNQVRAVSALTKMVMRIEKFERYVFGIHAASTVPATDISAGAAGLDFAVYTGSGNYIPSIAGTAQTPTNTVAMSATPASKVDGDWIQIEFTTTTTAVLSVSKNKGSTWTVIFTFTVPNSLFHFAAGSGEAFTLLSSTAAT